MRQKQQLSFKIEDQGIDFTSSVKVRGLFIDETLS